MSISISFSSLYSPTPSSLPFKSPHQIRLLTSHSANPLPLHSSLKTHFNPKRLNGFSGNNLRILSGSSLGFAIKAENEDKSGDEGEIEARGMSTMPERFRYLNQEAPDPPVRWPYFVALGFLVYAWRTVLWELYNWKKAATGIFHFVGYLSKLALALVFHFIGDPITSIIRLIEDSFYTVRALYSWVVACAPISEFTTIIILASTVCAIAEATNAEAVSSQPYLLTIAGITGFAAVRGLISELFFWTLLIGLFGFARFVKKRDYVSAALPAAAVLAAVGEPWVRVIVIALYLALAIIHHSKKPSDKKEVEATTTGRRVPIPLLCAAMAIGIRVAAKWAGYRHLTWMIV
ncbi:uncharacterized protein LOC141721023 [Apium graveolens]|uniref:uncharacterized protein LOC141721023 n=1 Tax=Apium graveolens TaxID=4045 RepID=UPI003D7B739E